MAAYKKLNSGFLPFIQEEKVASPYTTIQNRAKIDSSLKAIFGNERIHVNSLNLLTKEFGPNGQPVYEPDNGDARVRFVGNWTTPFDTHGQYVQCALNNEFVEITFYGTGLNALLPVDTSGRNAFPTVDGGAEGADIFLNTSGILNGRNYKSNQIVPVTSGLSLGWHTVKIRNDGTSINPYIGFEIINEASQITIMSGKAHGNGYEYELASPQLIDYKLGFDNVLDVNVGTRGGRAFIYLDPTDGTIKKRLTKTDSAAAYLSSADHTNEAIYRKINFREFGRNRGDDFSTLSTSGANVTFVLDDGTTTLEGATARVPTSTNSVGVGFNTTSSFLTFTFVGTGLDIISDKDNIGGDFTINTSINGTLQGTIVPSDYTQGDSSTRIKICSGLPYGTHTVKFQPTGTFTLDMVIRDFVVYQPKKPTLPDGAIEIAEYSIMADYVANATAGLETIPTGSLRKSSMREFLYTNTWTIPGIDPANYIAAHAITSSVNGAYTEYTFFGTGFEVRGQANTTFSSDSLVSLASSSGALQTLNTTNFPSIVTSNYGGFTFNNATGTLAVNASNTIGSGFSVSGLPLGLYKVRITNNTSSAIVLHNIDIITPIHSPHTTFGSRSLKDLRNFDSRKDVNKKEKGVRVYGDYNSSSGICFKSIGISQMVDFGTGQTVIYFENPFTDHRYEISATGDYSRMVGWSDDSTISFLKSAVRIGRYNHSGNLVHGPTKISFLGITEEKELEE